MVFKNECTRFLDAVTGLRKSTIEKEVQKELELKHAPYITEMERVRDEVIAQENTEAERQIRAIQERRDSKIQTYRIETAKAVETHRTNLIAETTARVSKDYDNFILGVSKLVDDTNIKE